jgi:hypothetical protein
VDGTTSGCSSPSAKACEKLLAELAKIEDAAAKRLAQDPHAAGTADAAVVTMLFEAPPNGARAH